MESAAQILVISPDDAVLRVAERCLIASGYGLLAATTLRKAQRSLTRAKVDAICIDSVLPTGEVEKLLRWLCDSSGRSRPPIVILAPGTAKIGTNTLPGCFQDGCDGVVRKPVTSRELTRVVGKVVAAGTQRNVDDVLRVGDVALDGVSHELRLSGGHVLRLTPTEFRLLRYLMQRPGELSSSDELLEGVWGYSGGLGGAQLVRAHVSNLRRKLRDKGGAKELIRTVPYRGYGVSTEGPPFPKRKAG
jgi:DNA-binding response OmpR family regulator